MAYSYLIPSDYQPLIQAANLQQIISNDPAILNKAQLAAEAQAVSYLRQKYDVTQELKATCPWRVTKSYLADDTVYLDAPAYDFTNGVYAVGALVLQNGNVYINITAVIIPEVFKIAKWTLLGSQYQIFYVTLPQPLFNYLTIYLVTNPIFWRDYTYLCLQATAVLDAQLQYQQGQISNSNVKNVFPDDAVNGSAFWGSKTAFSVAAGTLPTDTTKWTAGDNRDQELVMYFVDLTLFHAHTRIAPHNIPKIRVERYRDAIDWLRMCAEGSVTPELPILQPKQGGRIRFGGQPKAQNQW